MLKSEFDTIAAIATPIGEGGISVLRLSGAKALPLAAKLFRGTSDLQTALSHSAHVGYLHNAGGEQVDEVVCTVFRAPKSYTGEDVVEISCHGGMLVTQRILEAILNSGVVRSAEPGEFTKRAFLNGKMDLTQAEAVADLIHSRSDAARSGSLQQLKGELAEKIRAVRSELIDSVGLLELELDFSEDGYELADKTKVLKLTTSTAQQLSQLIESYKEGKLRREGAKVVLVGAPNVGKSSLLNRLLHENRAIVTETPGTTRDVIEESIQIGGLLFRLVDTAGLRETQDPVELEGIRRTNAQIQSADIVVFMFDLTREATLMELNEIKRISAETKEGVGDVLVVANKIDVISRFVTHNGVLSSALRISAKENIGVEDLKKKMAEVARRGGDTTQQSVLVTSQRHLEALNKAKNSTMKAIQSLKEGSSSEFVALDLRGALDYLGEITGEVTTDEILESIFSKFCIGK
jgi:tRNA modification GTPase